MTARVISALVAAGVLAATAIFGGVQGIFAICSLVALVCMYEYSRITFRQANAPFHLRADFVFLSCAVYFSVVFADQYALIVLAISAVLFATLTLLTVVRKEDVPRALQVIGAGFVGFLYCAVLAGFVTKTATFERGEAWLLGLLAIVFAGDTFAYFAGRAFGKRKLLEPVSPKKTMEGAAGGIVGSMIAGGALGWFVFPEISFPMMLALSVTTSVFAQAGDLFESLLKRAAEVKDSGSIMPGHGGLLDRVDGVYFAGPVYYLMAKLLSAG